MLINQTNNGATPLSIASEKGHKDIVELLLNMKNIDVNKATNKGSNTIIIASENGHKDIVELLLNMKNIDVNKPDREMDTKNTMKNIDVNCITYCMVIKI